MAISYITGRVTFKSLEPLEEVGKLLSDAIFGGVPFIGKDEHIYDEVPAVYLQHELLGLWVVLVKGSEDLFHLETSIATTFFLRTKLRRADLPQVDLTDYVRELIRPITAFSFDLSSAEEV